ncbi:tyrosine-type recombinase/integrase [Treponema brennaborense]|uniref:tyrosine-type recombinase/integrase n=1 Tax=Treponema brennaborense TaxID=81028 RepID=UPI000A006E7B|nr:tyrosine-type recombinase/integrase [Treponema brennaborense]
MLTGLRIGEILAFTPKDLGVNKIYVQHSFAVRDGLKCPKNGETRIVPAPSELLEQLRKQGQTNPYGQGENDFIFWSTTNPNKPFDNKTRG